MISATQSRFAEALLDRARPLPEGLQSWTGAEPRKRYGIYRNNVATGFIRAVAARFPTTVKIVGEEFFTAMAREFVRRTPPSSPVLLHYGEDFADFVAGFAPAASLPYLPDIARLENAHIRAYHARDIVPIEVAAMSRISPDRMSGLTFVFHPSASIARSLYPIVTIWAMNCGEQPLGPIAAWEAQDALITRPELSVLTRKIEPGSAVFLLALIKGAALGSAFEAAMDADQAFDLGLNLAELLRSGAVIDIISEPSLEA